MITCLLVLCPSFMQVEDKAVSGPSFTSIIASIHYT